jgi:hypothetical protein
VPERRSQPRFKHELKIAEKFSKAGQRQQPPDSFDFGISFRAVGG